MPLLKVKEKKNRVREDVLASGASLSSLTARELEVREKGSALSRNIVAQLELKCENEDLFLHPRPEKLYEAFHSLVDEIAAVARHLPPLESWARVRGRGGADGERIDASDDGAFASPPRWYLDEAHRRLDLVLREAFRPLCDHVEELRLRFDVVYGTDARRDAVARAEQERSLEECVAKVEDFNRLVREINGMVGGIVLRARPLCPVFAVPRAPREPKGSRKENSCGRPSASYIPSSLLLYLFRARVFGFFYKMIKGKGGRVYTDVRSPTTIIWRRRGYIRWRPNAASLPTRTDCGNSSSTSSSSATGITTSRYAPRSRR